MSLRLLPEAFAFVDKWIEKNCNMARKTIITEEESDVEINNRR